MPAGLDLSILEYKITSLSLLTNPGCCLPSSVAQIEWYTLTLFQIMYKKEKEKKMIRMNT